MGEDAVCATVPLARASASRPSLVKDAAELHAPMTAADTDVPYRCQLFLLHRANSQCSIRNKHSRLFQGQRRSDVGHSLAMAQVSAMPLRCWLRRRRLLAPPVP